MRVISLYSFKGGVGRTSLALNLAYQLALQAKFVVLADWDLHAPGLSLMDDLAMPNGPFPRKGILDFLWSALPPLGNPDRSTVEVVDPLLLAQTTVLATRSRPDNRSFGDIFFVPAGQFGPGAQGDYPDSLRKLHLPDLVTWRALLSDSGVEQSVLRFFRERIGEARSEAFGKDYAPDFLLLDSRTGITEIGDLLLGSGVDHYVVLFGLNEQNQAGMEMIVRSAQEHVPAGGLPDALSLIASPVPVGEEDLLRERLTALNARLGRLARPLEDASKTEPLPPVLRIPYHPRLALREEVIVERYPESALAQTYRDIATHILQQERTLESTEANTRVQILADVPPAPMVGDSVDYITLSSVNRFPNPRRKAPRHYVDPPRWNWVDPSLKPEQLVPGVPPELSGSLLDGLAWSSSLHWKEKLRVMDFAAILPAPRVARLTVPLIKERESKIESWENDWRHVEVAHARAATDWIDVLGRLRRVDVDSAWLAIAKDEEGRILPEAFASPRLLYLIARELVVRSKFRAAIPLFVRALSSAAFHPVSTRANELTLRLISLDLETMDESQFQAVFPEEVMEAFQAVLDLHAEEALSLANAMAATRLVNWQQESSLFGNQIWHLGLQGAENWANLAYEYRMLDDFLNAERAAKEAIAQKPRLAGAWALLASSLAPNTSRSTEAREALQMAEQLASDASELRRVALVVAEDFREYDKGLRLYEKVVASEEPSDMLEIELAEIAVLAHARDVARQALDRARHLLEEPLGPRFNLRLRTRRSTSAFHVVALALALLENDSVRAGETGKLLLDAVKQYGRDDWRCDALVPALSHLPDKDLRLLKGATVLARDGDVAAFEVVLEDWSRTRH